MRLPLLTALIAATVLAQPQLDKRLVFSTFHGGDRHDDAPSVAVAPDGHIYIVGQSDSRDLNAPAVGGKPLSAAVSKGYITKYAPNGEKIVWRFQIGGSANTVPTAVTLDRNGNAWVTGRTQAGDFPVVNAVQPKIAGKTNAFLMKFDADGKLVFSTYFGGEAHETSVTIAADSQGSVYIAGRATSAQLPVKNALQAKLVANNGEGFIAKYTAAGELEYATYLGGKGSFDNIHSIAVGPDDSLYVAGENADDGLATPGAWIKEAHAYSSFAARISPDGSRLMYYTYIGAAGGYTVARAIAVDAEGRAWLAGHTSSKRFATTANAIQPAYGGGRRDAFLLRVTGDGSNADYVSYLGGSFHGDVDPDETISSIKVDHRGFVVVAGETYSPDFPGRRALQQTPGGVQDMFLVKLDADNNEIIYSTFWGGTKKDEAQAVALGPGEQITVAGESFSADLPVSAKAVQPKIGSTNDGFVVQICEPWLGSWPTDSAAFSYTIGGDRPQPLQLTVYSGCTQEFDATEMDSSQPWLTVMVDKRVVPAKLTLAVNVDGLAPGEHTAKVRVTVPEAYRPTIEIPVKLLIADQ